ncbi:ATPase [Mycobacterium kansasii]|uniref:ATPase n=1 Tax=Mycobacterium kansasii TaxID=1768 RepID=UPI000CDDA1E3|nr:ATPase [Mycobacterium kansasii]POY04837.1 ATPase [Mycobacterium kansasii]POY29150.1 ATPase [Mycobacterium kansasii]POY34257.1 ATPase [Mycobacterium kansasii]
MPLTRLDRVLRDIPTRIVACSGGVDSLLLATVAHRAAPQSTTVAHAVTPAVPAAATARVVAHAEAEGWTLQLVRSKEFDDERYLSNPRNRCYFCKSHLYTAIRELPTCDGATMLSGANFDDLGEYRPGLIAAEENHVRHPYVEAGLGKEDIRSVARTLALDFADLPASPCLASRLYTDTAVTPSRLRSIEIGEDLLRMLTGIDVVRCRLREDVVLIEVRAEDAARVTDDVIDRVAAAMRRVEPSLHRVVLDDKPYRPGRALELLA